MEQRFKWMSFFGVLFLSGCLSLPPEGVNPIDWLMALWNGTDLPSSQVSPSPSPSVVEEDSIGRAASEARANAEILHEMLQVVFMREPKDRAEFGNWTDTLNQGASLEGVYNGLTHSADYRKLEVANVGAAPQALRVFAEELAALEVELPVPTQFNTHSAAPLPVLDATGANLGATDTDGAVQEMEFKKNGSGTVPVPSSTANAAALSASLIDAYPKLFVGASIYTLKRVLGDEALKVIASQGQYREKLANWYSKWVVRLTQRKVDFGISLRNNPDAAFHYKWALQSKDDRIKWEVLNRLHRLLNEANRHSQ